MKLGGKSMKKVLLLVCCMLMIGCSAPKEDNAVVENENEQVNVSESTEELPSDSDETSALFSHLNVETIASENAMNIIAELADEKYGGRQAGLAENEAAEDYLVDLFESTGLEAVESLGGYKQEYTQMAAYPISPTKVTIEGTDISFEYQKDFTERFRIGYTYFDTETQAEMIFIKSSSELVEDIDRFDDKVILMPQDVYYSNSTFTNLELMTRKGINVEAVITASEAPEAGMRVARGVRGDGFKKFEEEDPVLLVFSYEKFNELVNYSEEGHKINIHMDYEVEEVTVANIVGVIHGKHEFGEDETIILGAHFDHVGNNMDGTFNAGALDNASGVSVIVELARIILSGDQPEDDIIIVAFNGEEDGLIGSEYFSKNPPHDYKALNTKMLNLDMVGSSNPVPLYIATSSAYSTSMKDELALIADEIGIDYEKENMGYSDHVNFSDTGVKSVMLIHLDYAYYHTAMDTLENAIDEYRLEEVIQLCLAFVDQEIYE